jgi:hypothetical protein
MPNDVGNVDVDTLNVVGIIDIDVTLKISFNDLSKLDASLNSDTFNVATTFGIKTLGKTTFSITTFSIKTRHNIKYYVLNVIYEKTQHFPCSNKMLIVVQLLNFAFLLLC